MKQLSAVSTGCRGIRRIAEGACDAAPCRLLARIMGGPEFARGTLGAFFRNQLPAVALTVGATSLPAPQSG